MEANENNEIERADCYEHVAAAALFLALHEATHVLRKHSLVQARFASAAEGRRGAEVDADYFGARNLALWCVNDTAAKGQPVRVRELCIRANTSTYAVWEPVSHNRMVRSAESKSCDGSRTFLSRSWARSVMAAQAVRE
jgi:hypothetical protein